MIWSRDLGENKVGRLQLSEHAQSLVARSLVAKVGYTKDRRTPPYATFSASALLGVRLAQIERGGLMPRSSQVMNWYGCARYDDV